MRQTDLSALPPAPAEIAVLGALVAIQVSVFIASFRRNRCLFERSVVESVAVGVFSAVFWPVWCIASIANHRQVSALWTAYRDTAHREAEDGSTLWSRLRARSRDRPVRRPSVPLAVLGVYLLISNLLKVGDNDSTWGELATFGAMACGVALVVSAWAELVRYRAHARRRGPVGSGRLPWRW